MVAFALALVWVVLAIVGGAAEAQSRPGADVELFTREGCPHCGEAKRWTRELAARRPDLAVVVTDVADADARRRLDEVVIAHRVRAASVPTIVVRGTPVVGWSAATPARIEALLVARAPSGATVEGGVCSADAAEECTDEVDLPIFGRASASAWGLPAFTLAIGLVDGFNPCAMWVLLLLLSLLVNVKSRPRMALVAGVFVFVSGAAYFAFMAAWLNAFLLVGISRAVQISLGIVAVAVGAVHVKDFFAMGRGPSLSIPAKAKPGLYARMRAIVNAEALVPALVAASVLAVMVNAIELLCTAGLPAVYTEVLASHGLAPWKRYAYLLLYIAAYMADDTLMVILAVATLGRRKLQQRAGRGLKLLSGVVIVALGALLVFRPEWLAW